MADLSKAVLCEGNENDVAVQHGAKALAEGAVLGI